MVSGTELPVRSQPPPVGSETLRTASPDYVATEDQQQDEYDDRRQVTVRRVTDGSIVTSYDIANQDSHHEPWLVDTSLLAFVLIGSSSNGHDQLQVRDVETGALSWSQDVPVNEVALGAGPTWLLTRGSDGVHLYTPTGAIVLTQMSGTDSSLTLVASDATFAVLQDLGNLWAVDTTAGVATQITKDGAPDDVDPYGRVALGPTKVFWINTIYPATGPQYRIFSVSRDNLSGGSTHVDTPGYAETRGWLAFGSGLAEMRTTGGGLFRVDSVDLNTGELRTAVLSKVIEARTLRDGGIGATLADTPTGSVVVIHDDGRGPHTVFRLMPRPYPAMKVALSGTVVAADFGDPHGSDDDSSQTTTYFHAVDGSGAWSQSYAGTGNPVTGSLRQVAGDVTATTVTNAVRLTWPGGSRDVTPFGGFFVLGRGGQYVAVGFGSHSLTGWHIEPARSDVPLEDIPPDQSIALDHTWLWTGPDRNANLSGTDLSGRAAARTVNTGLNACAYPSLQVAGTWALVQCRNNSEATVTDSHVIDLTGGSAAWTVPIQPGESAPQLGNGFVGWTGFVRADDGSQVEALHVADLGPNHETRIYGPLHGKYTPPYPSYSLNDDNSPTLVYLDARRQPSWVNLDWLSTPPTPSDANPDTAPPVITHTSGTPSIGTSKSVTLRWTASDPGADSTSGLSYDVRFKLATPGAASYSTWQYPTAWQDLTSTSVSTSAATGSQICFEIRAIDRAGNVSEFGAHRCHSVAYDDRALKGKIGIKRLRSAGAAAGTLTRLTHRGAVLSRPEVAGSSVDVRVKRGPRQGAAKVFVGSHLIGTISFRASAWRFASVRLSLHGHTGSVRIQSTSSEPSLVDELAVLR